MSTDLPAWALQLIYELDRYEDEHAKGADCLQELLNLVPADVLAGIRFASKWTPAPRAKDLF